MTRERWWLIVDHELKKYFQRISDGELSAEEAYAALCEQYVIEPILGINWLEEDG